MESMCQERKKVVERVRAGLRSHDNIEGIVVKVETDEYPSYGTSNAVPHGTRVSHLHEYLDNVTKSIFSGRRSSFTVVNHEIYRTHARNRHGHRNPMPTDTVLDTLIHQKQSISEGKYEPAIGAASSGLELGPNSEGKQHLKKRSVSSVGPSSTSSSISPSSGNNREKQSPETPSNWKSRRFDALNDVWQDNTNAGARTSDADAQETAPAAKGSSLHESGAQNGERSVMKNHRHEPRLARRRLLMVEEDIESIDNDVEVHEPKVKQPHVKGTNERGPASSTVIHRVPVQKTTKVLQYRRVVRRMVRRRVYKRILRPRYETVTVERVIRVNPNDDSSKAKKRDTAKQIASPIPTPTPTGQEDDSVSVRSVVRNLVRLVMRSGAQGEGRTNSSGSSDTGLLSEERSQHGAVIVGPEDYHDRDMGTSKSVHTDARTKREMIPRANSVFEDNVTLVDVPVQPRLKVQMRMSIILQGAALTDGMNRAIIACMSSASGIEGTEWGAFDADRFTTELVHIDYFVHLVESKVESFARTVDSYVRNGNLTDCLRNNASAVGFGQGSGVFVGKTVYKPEDVEIDLSEYGTPSWVIGVGIAITAVAGVIALLVLTSQSQNVSLEDDSKEAPDDYTEWVGSPVVMVNERLIDENEVDGNENGDEDERELEKIAGAQHVITLSSLPH